MPQLVLSTQPLNFKSDAGDEIKGLKLSYIEESETGDNRGYKPILDFIDGELGLKLEKDMVEVPGYYELQFKRVAGKNNKAKTVIVGSAFIKKANLGL